MPLDPILLILPEKEMEDHECDAMKKSQSETIVECNTKADVVIYNWKSHNTKNRKLCKHGNKYRAAKVKNILELKNFK